MVPIHDSIASYLEVNQPQRAVETLAHTLASHPDMLADIAAQLAAPLTRLYHDYHIEPLEQFAELCEEFLAPDQSAAILAPVRPGLDAARQWGPRLEAVFNERLTRELRDATQLGDLKAAAVRLPLLLHPRLPADERLQKARYVGSVLGAISTHQEYTQKLLTVLTQNASRLHLTDELLAALRAERDKTYAQIGRVGAGAQSDLRDEFISLVVDIQRQLPSRMEMREPTAEEIDVFLRIGRALFGVAFLPSRKDRLVDAAQVLLDFYPRELSELGARAGVQARAYQALGFTAKKLCLLGLGRLGESPRLCQLVLDFYKAAAATAYQRQGIELMGALRSPKFHDYLHAALHDSARKADRADIVKALSMIGEPEALDALLDALRDAVKAKVIDPPRVKKALGVIEALGRVTRSPRLTERDRVALTEKAIKILPENQRRLTCALATQFFSHNPAALPEHQRDWAARQLTHALWAGDETPSFAEGDEQQSDFLGSRRDLVATLKILGRDSLPAILEAADQHVLNYSGAYLALGEVLTEFGDERAVPLLEKMILLAVNLDESAVGKYQQETFWDAAARERRPLGKNHVIDTLVFALSRIDSPEARRVLRETATFYRRGKAGAPSETTARILMDAEKSAAGIDGDQNTTDDDAEPNQYDEDDVRRAIKTLNSRGLLTSKEALRMKKIPAMQVIADTANFDGLIALVQHLDDKDHMTQETAEAAIGNFGQRLTKPTLRKAFLVELVEAVSDLKEDGQQRLGKLIQDFIGGDDDLTKQFTAYLESVDNPTMRRILSQSLLAIDKEKEKHMNLQGNDGDDGGGFPVESSEGNDAQSTKYAEMLEAKRQYLIARKEWIAGGKKGPEPEKPF